MEFLITESQLKTILTEEEKSMMSGYMKELNSFTKVIVNRTLKSYGINLRMLLTWGTSVGGMVLPLDQYLKTGNFNLTEEQRMLVLAGIAFTLFFETKKPLTKLINTIKDEGLEDVYNNGLRKGKELKSSFLDFMSSINVSVGSFMETIAYSFLIPIILDIQHIAINASEPKEAAIMIAERLVSSGVVLIGTNVLSKTIRKIIDKLNR
jgi:hypothetical protein